MRAGDQKKQRKQDLKQRRNPSSAGAGNSSFPHGKLPVPAGTTQHSGPILVSHGNFEQTCFFCFLIEIKMFRHGSRG